MKKPLSNLYRRMLPVILLLLVLNIILLITSIRQYTSYQTQIEDKSLEYIVNSVDGSLDFLFDHYQEELEYVTSRRGFLEDEAAFLDGKGTKGLKKRLDENLLNQEAMVATMVAFQDRELIVSTDENADYWIPQNRDPAPGLSLGICFNDALKPYLAIVQYKEAITYAALIDPVHFYERIENSSGLKSMGDMILTDADHSLFLYRDKDRVVADLLLDEGETDNPLLQLLLSPYNGKTTYIDFFDVQEGPYSKSYRARVAVYPAELTENKFLSIGVLHDIEDETTMLQKTFGKLLFAGGMIIATIMLLMYYLVRISLQEARNAREIQRLQEKQAAVEAVNEKMMDLAHHQRLETIGQLTSGIAHEFNNLLTPIMGYSLMVMENLPPEDTDSYDNLLEIYEASQKAKELIGRLSDLSRKNTAVTMRYVNPNEIVRKALAMTDSSKPNHIDVVAHLLCKDVWLYGNETQLTQMFMNLILNAFHAIGDETGTVLVENYQKDDQICFRITDSGKGIPKEMLDKIFQPFFTTKEQGRGTGLGLAIVSQTVEEHKGKISVTSEVGKGSCFELAFPMKFMD